MSKIKGMTTQERLEDISKRAGLSIEICRRVLSAESDSIVESLKHGERATLIGRATLRPEMRQRLGFGGTVENSIRVKAEVSSSLEASLENITEFIDNNYESEDTTMKNSGIRLRQITSLL